jgi:hypothetical protein
LPIAQTADQLAIAESVSQWASRACTIAAVRQREGAAGAGADQKAADRWAGLAELGVFSIGWPADLGGDGTVADLAVAAEQLAAALVPGPVLPTLLAGLVLARSDPGRGTATRALLERIAAGSASVAVAIGVGQPSLTGTVQAEGRLAVSGTAGLVLGAGEATHLLLAAETGDGQRWFLVDGGEPGVTLTAREPVDFSLSLADVTLDDVQVSPGQVLAWATAGLVSDLAVTLAAAQASGVAAWCSRTATQYAKVRQQFGRPIGSFQAIKHLCAHMLCRAELAVAAAWDAACAADQAPAELPLAAAAAGAVALDAAVDNAKDCIQVLGGIGFTWEHDAHLYLRRALGLRSLLGGSQPWRARAAELTLAGLRRHPFTSGKTSGDNEPAQAVCASTASAAGGQLSQDRADSIRSAARVVASAVSAMPAERRRAGLVEVGYAAPAWPPPYGLSAGPATQMIIDEELAKAGLSRPEIDIGGWAIPAIAAHGTTDQLARFAGPTLRGEITWCQLFSEPEAGSDLASLRTKAVRAPADRPGGPGWLLTGQKVWTSLAGQAGWAICLARTDQAAPKHKGITYFLVAMDDPGIEVRPLREITGRAMFNEVFLDDVFVPDDCVVGQPGDGWKIARVTLATERVAMVGGARLSEDVEALLSLAGAGAPADAAVLDQVGARIAEGLALAVMDDRMAQAIASGREAGMTAAVRKLLGVAHRQAVAEATLSLQGSAAAAADGAAQAAVHEFLLTRCLSIAGGTTQILLSLVAERVLGLPRDEAR